jgi:hypothetical protein
VSNLLHNSSDRIATILAFAQWEKREDYGPEVEAAWLENSDLQEALEWECVSCDDGGWAKWERLERVCVSCARSLTAYIECGHCGDITEYVLF